MQLQSCMWSLCVVVVCVVVKLCNDLVGSACCRSVWELPRAAATLPCHLGHVARCRPACRHMCGAVVLPAQYSESCCGLACALLRVLLGGLGAHLGAGSSAPHVNCTSMLHTWLWVAGVGVKRCWWCSRCLLLARLLAAGML